MKYMGSKSRIISGIAPIIQDFVNRSPKKAYYEPFCGGCNVIDHIKADIKFAADKQKYLIALFQNLHLIDELPEFVSKEHYAEVRNDYNCQSGKFPDWYIGAIGFLASYNGRFFDGGYAGVVNTKSGTVRNYYAEAKRNLEAQAPSLSDVRFVYKDYRDTRPLSGYVIYCDPPYFGTKQYGASKHFDYTEFWDWVRMFSRNNTVLVSEHNAPNDFECIWEQPVLRTIDNTKRVKATEKIFIYK